MKTNFEHAEIISIIFVKVHQAMSQTFVITAKAENVLRVLQKLTSLMSRKRLQIQDMQVSETSSPGESYLTLTLQADVDHVQWLVKQLKKCVDLFDLYFKNK